ncbi:MAG: hypothetical protein WB443_12455 [Nitrososphaeraceae archaeon]
MTCTLEYSCSTHTHTMATHQKMPKPIYSSAGDGYFESFDFGESWRRTTTGLKHHYLYGLPE